MIQIQFITIAMPKHATRTLPMNYDAASREAPDPIWKNQTRNSIESESQKVPEL